jgi:hypothetical protein
MSAQWGSKDRRQREFRRRDAELNAARRLPNPW